VTDSTPGASHDAGDPLTILSGAAALLALGSDVDATLAGLIDSAVAAVGASFGAVYLQDPDRSELQLAVAAGLDDDARAALESSADDPTDAPAIVARDRNPMAAAPGPFRTATGAAAAELRPLVVARAGVELPLGVLSVGWSSAHDVTPDEGAILDALASLAAVAVDRGRLASLIAERSEWFERIAHADPLTGLANDRTFARVLELELARAGRQGGELSLALFDVDGFAATNASAGHEAGDDILRAVASVLAESVRLVDTVARFGGDEFVVVAPGAAGVTVARRVLEGIAQLEPVGGTQVTVSAGVARFPVDGATSEELLAAAGAALDQARAVGGGGVSEAAVGAG
jgi:diguanylate cyclase (GGDEF)-like protein